jgi:hypothetical protein
MAFAAKLVGPFTEDVLVVGGMRFMAFNALAGLDGRVQYPLEEF